MSCETFAALHASHDYGTKVPQLAFLDQHRATEFIGQHLREFLKWKTAAEKEDLNRWANGVTKWKEQAEEHVCKLYRDGSATLTLRRAAALVAKFTAEFSLHGWIQHQNLTLGIPRNWELHTTKQTPYIGNPEELAVNK